MSYIRTRGQLLDRMAVDRQDGLSDSGTFTKAVGRRYLDQCWAILCELLGSSETSYQLSEVRLTATTQDFVNLPDDFTSIRQLSVMDGGEWVRAERTTLTELITDGVDERESANRRLYKWLRDIEGTNPEVEVLRFYPTLSAGQEVRIAQHRAAQSLANADGTYVDTTGLQDQDTTIVVNLYQATIADVLIAMARARAANHADAAEYQKAVAQSATLAASAVERIAQSQQRDDRPSRLLSSYATSHRRY